MADNQEAFELATDLSEVALDRVVDNEFLRDIPIIGSAVKIARLGQSLSDRLFIAKVGVFLKELEKISDQDRKKMLTKVIPLSPSAEKVSEQLLFALEKIDTLAKSRLISALFRALVEERLDQKVYMKLVFSVVNSYWGDLKPFLFSTEPEFVAEFDTLVANGLIYNEMTWENIASRGEVKYSPTNEGLKLREICRPFISQI